MENRYDAVVIGSGLGGLVSALILAKNGYKVVVLEKNKQFGGNLQTFSRDKRIFETGVHYIGSLGEGEILNTYFKYLGIMDDLKIKKLDDEAFDVITFGDEKEEFYQAQGYDRFAKSLTNQFPDEQEAITKYCLKVQEICKTFPLYNLNADIRSYDMENLSIKLVDFLDSITDNELLKAVLVGNNFLYAGDKETPFYVHALSVNSYIESSWRCINGSSQITKSLIKKIKEFGGEAYKHAEVTKIHFDKEENKVTYVEVNGEQVFADKFISNIDPKYSIQLLDGNGFRNSYIKRVNKIKNTISCFSLYIVLKPNTFKYQNRNYYHFKKVSKVFEAQDYSPNEWPDGYMVSMGVKPDHSEWGESMTVLTYMRYDEMQSWEASFNTVSSEAERGRMYEAFKAQKSEALIKQLEEKFPNLRDCIQSVYSSTPLSYRDYIGGADGNMYGYVKEADRVMECIISPKTRIPNFFFTGQSLNMHGVVGVTIGAFLTCSYIVGMDSLIDDVKAYEL